MYGDKVDQYQLQFSFYTLYEPEIQSSVQLLSNYTGTNKKLLKELPKFASTYLLDILELNTKSRSVFCWSGKNPNVFTPFISVDFVSNSAELLWIYSRR